MKRLIIFAIGLMFVGALSAQTTNAFRYVLKARGGVTIGMNGTYSGSTFTLDSDSKIKNIDSLVVDDLTTPTLFKMYSGGTQLIPDIPSAGYESIYDFAARKYLTDTLLVTDATYTLVLADAGRVIYCNHATFQEITIPAEATTSIPIGTIITFIKTGAGPVILTPAANVIRKSVLDSTTMNTVNQTYQIVKRATNKWYYVGNWVD